MYSKVYLQDLLRETLHQYQRIQVLNLYQLYVFVFLNTCNIMRLPLVLALVLTFLDLFLPEIKIICLFQNSSLFFFFFFANIHSFFNMFYCTQNALLYSIKDFTWMHIRLKDTYSKWVSESHIATTFRNFSFIIIFNLVWRLSLHYK